MKNVRIVLYHPGIDLLSDRTVRYLFKKLSSLCREIQRNEVEYIINEAPLDIRDRQSVRDRLQPELRHIPAYYVEKLEKGSIELTIALTAAGIWFLQRTVGVAIEDAFKKTKFYEWLVEFLSSEHRSEKIDRNIDAVIDKWIFDRFLVDNVQKNEDSDGNINVTIQLKTPAEIEDRLKESEEKIDAEFVLRKAEEMYRRFDQEKDA